MGAATVAAVVVLGGAVYIIQRNQAAVGDPSPSQLATQSAPTPSAEASQPTVVSPSQVAQSLELTWMEVDLNSGLSRVAWLGDRFVLVDDAGAVSTSTDGASWQVLGPGDPDPGYADLLRSSFATWEDDFVGWWTPDNAGPDLTNGPPLAARDVVRIVRPPAAPTQTTPFEGRIETMAIGPAGIVAQVRSHLDWDAWVASRLGADWVSHYTGVDFKNGILDIGMDNGPGLHVVWADEGFEPGDYMYSGFGWYSPDGEQWTLMPAVAPSPDGDGTRGFLTDFGEVVGVSDGFIARGIDTECTSDDGCAGIWHSADGLTWRNIANLPGGHERSVLPWRGGALVTDGLGHFDFFTSDSHTEWPMVADLPAAWTQANPFQVSFGSGPFGLVTVLKDDEQILLTRDGVDWEIQPIPAEMAADSTLRFGTPIVAVGDHSVLAVMWSGDGGAGVWIPSLWVGTPKP